MKVVVQRSKKSKVTINNKIITIDRDKNLIYQ